MITYDTGSMLRIILQLKGSVLLIVWPQMAVCAGIAVFATIMRAWVGADDYLIKDVKGHATLGTALAFLNVFRSNLSYGRYWDGRGHLGVLVKSGRELMRLVVTYTKIPEDEQQEAEMNECMDDVWRLINALMRSIVLAVQHFSGHFVVPPYNMDTELCGGGTEPAWLRPSESAAIQKAESIHNPSDNKGRPALIAALLSHKVYYMYHRGWMNAAVLKKCDKCIGEFVGAWMACEKIVGVPMVFPYTQMLSVFMVLFVYTFPFPLAHIFFNEEAEFNGFFITPFICALVAFAFFGMNAVGVEIENPFGDDDNDLPVKKMMKRVELDTAAMLKLRDFSDQVSEVANRRNERRRHEEELRREQEKQGALGGKKPRAPARS